MAAIKILVSGDADGKYHALFERVKRLQKSNAGPFHVLLCVGNFFADPESAPPKFKGAVDAESYSYLTSKEELIPIPTYFVTSNTSDLDLPEFGGQIAPNLNFLGKNGVRSILGLNVAYVSGKMFSRDTSVSCIESYTVNSLRDTLDVANDSYGGNIDILLTSEWPFGITSVGADTQSQLQNVGSDMLSDFLVRLQPRHHFAGLQGVFWQRKPYRNETAVHVTKFVALGKCDPEIENSNKEKKWLYACNMQPMSKLPTSQLETKPEDCTMNPFMRVELEKRTTEMQREMKARKEEEEVTADRKRRRRDDHCWFCINNIKPESQHLVVGFADYTYLALPKGPLDENHVLILPMQHYTNSGQLPKPVETEIQKWLASLYLMYKSRSKYFVMYERNISTKMGGAQHMNLQVYAIPDYIPEAEIKRAFLTKAAEGNFKFEKYTRAQSVPDEFFLITLPSEMMVHVRQPRSFFDFNFGRNVFAEIIGKPNRTNWRECEVSIEEEKKASEMFKKGFEAFDWTKTKAE